MHAVKRVNKKTEADQFGKKLKDFVFFFPQLRHNILDGYSLSSRCYTLDGCQTLLVVQNT